ncbi:MAG: hypothetical protein U1F46_06130 [Marinagarivorans sp.]
MQRVIQLLFAAFWLYAVYCGTSWHTPNLTELEFVTGTITQMQEIPTRRRQSKWHIEITLQQNGKSRVLTVYDASALRLLKAGDCIEAGIFFQNGAQELWTLKSETLNISLSETQRMRKALLGYSYYFAYAIGIFFIYIVIFKYEKLNQPD